MNTSNKKVFHFLHIKSFSPISIRQLNIIKKSTHTKQNKTKQRKATKKVTKSFRRRQRKEKSSTKVANDIKIFLNIKKPELVECEKITIICGKVLRIKRIVLKMLA